MDGDLNRYRSISELKSSVLDVDSVKKRSEILVLDDSGLLDSSANLGDIFQVDSLNSQVVLLLFLLADNDSLRGIDPLVHFEAQKVFYFYSLNKKGSTLPFSMTLTTMGKWE